LPVSTLTTSTSHDASVPNSWLHVPMRPYTAERGASESPRAIARIVSAEMPHVSATASGVNSRHSAPTSSMPFVKAASRPGRTRSSANSTCATASSSAASVPGRIATHSSA
jgi:hypothetical protein